MTHPKHETSARSRKRTATHSLRECALFGITNHRRLAKLLCWRDPPSSLRVFAEGNHYSRYVHQSRPGKSRTIQAPSRNLKRIQNRIRDLLSRVALPDYLHSGRKGRSYLSNSAVHCSTAGATVTVDIHNYYPSISSERIAAFFEKNLQCSPDISKTLARLLCCDGHLATGSPASTLVSFWVHRQIFDSIAERVSNSDGVFSLYVDDIAITGDGFGHSDVAWIQRLLRAGGLTLKVEKSRVFSKDAPKLVTGRAFRHGVSRAPNQQHLKMRNARKDLARDPSSSALRSTLVGRHRHLALLDEANSEAHRTKARRITKK